MREKTLRGFSLIDSRTIWSGLKMEEELKMASILLHQYPPPHRGGGVVMSWSPCVHYYFIMLYFGIDRLVYKIDTYFISSGLGLFDIFGGVNIIQF